MGCSWAALCIRVNRCSLPLLFLREELIWNSLVEKGSVPSEELNSILFLLGFEWGKEQMEMCGV